jgi:hypothetical protein
MGRLVGQKVRRPCYPRWSLTATTLFFKVPLEQKAHPGGRREWSGVTLISPYESYYDAFEQKIGFVL